MPKWLLPTLSEVLTLSDPTWMVNGSRSAFYRNSLNSSTNSSTIGQRRGGSSALRQLRAEREWSGAIAALSVTLQQFLDSSESLTGAIDVQGGMVNEGVVLSGPAPILSHPGLIAHLSTWTLATSSLHSPTWMPFQLLPAEKPVIEDERTPPVLPLLPGDPLAAEQFCLVLTPWFGLVMVMGETLEEEPAFMFSFAPEVVQYAWETLRARILLMSSHQIERIDELVQRFPPVAPDYRTVTQFSRLMLENLPESFEELRVERTSEVAAAEPTLKHPFQQTARTASSEGVAAIDVELLQAIAHEVRTPLSTIRTLTRSLLKRTDLSPDILRRLGIIDRECSEQIDRFGLIFRAVELETSTRRQTPMSLTRTSLVDVFQQNIPRWQQQANQHQMTLDVVLPERMPAVVSDPTFLDQALTSLIERFTRNLPGGSHIQVEVTLAGDQLKLQLQSQSHETQNSRENAFSLLGSGRTAFKKIGQVLMFQPETGSLSLNLAVTKNLFQALGGKLIVRERPQQGEVMTVYLPLEMNGSSLLESSNIITI